MSNELARLDATAQAALVRRREVKPIELVDAAIARIERLNPALNAVLFERFDEARREADAPELPHGPFHGVPMLLKDLGAASAGDPYCGGMRALRDAKHVETQDAYLTAKLRAAGFVLLGRTNTPELGLLPTTEPEAFGATRNPWDTMRSPGGSSGGSAAAVASGMVAVAHSSDGGGSIRIPASHCGLVGLKPSRGRNSFGPGAGERWGGLSTEGVVSWSVRDTAALLDVTSGTMPGDPYAAPTPARPYASEVGADPGRLRIGVMLRAPRSQPLHPSCREAAERAARALEALGHAVEERHPDALDSNTIREFVTLISVGCKRALQSWGERLGRTLGEADVEPLTWAVVTGLGSVAAAEYVGAVDRLHLYGREVARFWESGFDLLLTPTAAEPPPPLGEFAPKDGNPLHGFVRAAPFSTFTAHFNATGQPAISLPLHADASGLPVGVQLVAAYGREDLLIRVASQLEAAHPWRERRPAIHP
jgi:amidase